MNLNRVWKRRVFTVRRGSGKLCSARFFFVLGLLLDLLPLGRAAGAELSLSFGVSDAQDALEVSWESESVTAVAPFLHYEFQVESSLDLRTWTNLTEVVLGGVLAERSIEHRFEIPMNGAGAFYRLAYRLNMPGADLRGLDLSDADLREANLSGADLSDADLSGADLSGADLSGAQLAGAHLSGAALNGANLEGVGLDGLDLSGVDLNRIVGAPRLNQLNAPSAEEAGPLLPEIQYTPDDASFVQGEPGIPGIVSIRDAMVMLEKGATVEQLNALLTRHGGFIIASSPEDDRLSNGLLMVRFPTTTAKDLFDLTQVLAADPIVAAAAPDVYLGQTAVPDDSNGAVKGLSRWRWNNGLSGSEGGNWGWERARVPQMWNLKEALERRGVSRVPTAIFDNTFAVHEDLNFRLEPESRLVNVADLEKIPSFMHHGNHVSGIVGATYNNRRGTDGVNPFAELIPFTNMPRVGPTDPALEGKAFSGFQLVKNFKMAVTNAADTKIINISLGYNWSLTEDRQKNVLDPAELAVAEKIAEAQGAAFAAAASTPAAQSILVVVGAGNDDGLDARISSPMCNAALDLNVPNILVVESHGRGGDRSSSSNIGGHVAAPGEGILSTALVSGDYVVRSGTSMASPFVAGVAGFLLAADPALTPPALIDLIRRGGANVDAFTSVMEIDTLPGRNREMLRMLLDIDDGTPDGALRVDLPPPAINRERSFDLVLDGALNFSDTGGDGRVDMADFRRWRDWFLLGDGGHSLNGTDGHPKHDANRDGRVDRGEEHRIFPRADFNGDGELGRHGRIEVPGSLQKQRLTDVEVLMFGGLWQDEEYATDGLPDLIDSVDILVSAETFFEKNPAITNATVHIYDSKTRAPVLFGSAVKLSPERPVHLFTVPVGAEYYAASEPIPLEGGTNVMMRSIGEAEFRDRDRGGDFAVDLAVVEMTAVADVRNPDLRAIDSQPNAEEVDAHIPSGQDEPGRAKPDAISIGARGWANEEGTLYASVRAVLLPEPPPNPEESPTFTAEVRWQRSFIKDASLRDPVFLVKPMILRLSGIGPNGTDLNAFAEIIIEMRSYDISPEWQPVFQYRAEINGRAAIGESPATFEIVRQEGDLPPKALTPPVVTTAEYIQEEFKGTINLNQVEDGHSFEVRYRLLARAIGTGADNEAIAFVGDPLDYGSGIRMAYGSFGQLPRITALMVDDSGAGHVSYLSQTNFYYILYRGTNLTAGAFPVALKLGVEGPDELVDPAPPPGATPDSYTLENQPIDQPLDLDGDGIHDVYELQHPAILDPLDPEDAFADPDGDGFNNLAEFTNGTNPEVADAPSTQELRVPGTVVTAGIGGELVDLNNDGVWDIATHGGPGIVAAIGNADGTFRPPVESELPDSRFVVDSVFGRLDGDSFADALLVDALADRLSAFRGLGDGRFELLAHYPTMGGSQQIALGDLNGDGHTDAAVLSTSGSGADLYAGAGDGTLTQLAPVTTNLFGRASGFGLGDFNGDQRDDVVITFFDEAVVLLSQPDGSYQGSEPYAVGSAPESVATGDLNKDGHMDIVIANRTRGDVSVLLGSGAGAFLPEVRYPVTKLPLGLRLADLNGDTFLDAVVSHVDAEHATVLLNLGNGAFAAPYGAPSGSGGIAGIVDWNDDGRLDLVSGIPTGLLVNLGRGDGTFAGRSDIVTTNDPPKQVAPIDLNADNRLELVALAADVNRIDVWEHASVFSTNRLVSSFDIGPFGVAFAPDDFNGDGRVDLAVITQALGTRGTNQVLILMNQDGGSFAAGGVFPLDFVPQRILSGDFDGDGDADVGVLSLGGTLNGGTRLVAFLGNGSGGFEPGVPVVVANTVSFAEPADVDGDLRDELILQGNRIAANAFESFVEVFGLAAGGSWTTEQTVSEENPASMQILNVNGDAHPDLVVLETGSSAGRFDLALFAGGPGGLAARSILAEDVPFQAFQRLTDLNGDGNLDAVSFNTLFLGKPGGGFQDGQEIWIGSAGVEEVADFNSDGRPDLMSGLGILLQE